MPLIGLWGMLLLLMQPGIGRAASDDRLWIPEGSNVPILKNHPTERTQVCKYRAADGSCYRLWLNDPADPHSHLPIPWLREEDFRTLLSKLDGMEEGGYCLIYEGQEWSDWTGQGAANTACGERPYSMEESYCQAPADACDDRCLSNSRRTRSTRVRNAACPVAPIKATAPIAPTETIDPTTPIEALDPAVTQDPVEPPSPIVENPIEPPSRGFPPCGWYASDVHQSDVHQEAGALSECQWQPGELIGRMRAPERGLGLHSYPWGALSGACSLLDDSSPRHYYENRGGRVDKPQIGIELLLYIQYCY